MLFRSYPVCHQLPPPSYKPPDHRLTRVSTSTWHDPNPMPPASQHVFHLLYKYQALALRITATSKLLLFSLNRFMCPLPLFSISRLQCRRLRQRASRSAAACYPSWQSTQARASRRRLCSARFSRLRPTCRAKGSAPTPAPSLFSGVDYGRQCGLLASCSRFWRRSKT